MRNLKVWQKLAVMGAMFMIPFAGVTYKMTSSINALGLQSSRMELQGLEYYTPALALVRNLQLHRGMTSAALNGATSFQDLAHAKRADIESNIKAIDDVDRRLGEALNTSARWTAVRSACQELLRSGAAVSADESFARHSRAITGAILLISEIAHHSNLTQDQDIHRRHLVDVLVSEGPELAESLARASGYGVGVLVSGKKTPEQFERLNRDLVLVEFFGAKLDESLAGAIDTHEGFRGRLKTVADTTSESVLRGTADVGHLARGDDVTIKATEYFSGLARSVDAIVELENQVAAALHEALTEEIATLRREVFQTLALAGLGLLVVCAIGFFIIRDVTVSLTHVVEMANQIALGELTAPPASKPRRDEIGVLETAFAKMVAALKQTVDVAECIASGDLAVTVWPRSERDALGLALTNMVGRLSALVGDVQRSGIQVNTSVNQIAATAKQQQATATEIAATTTQISATSREIATTSKDLVKTMSEVAGVAEQSATLAATGQVGVSRMEGTMRHVMEAAGSINAKLAVLNEKAGGITQVVTTITKVADQTNLLSLNAAIEAEKAGEYGRGFAVVATEIRRLADQTAVATYDIEQMVKEIQAAVSAGVMGMDKFSEEVRKGMHDVQQVGHQLTQIIQQVQALAPRFDVVNEGMQAQANGAEQITQALAQLGDAVQQTVESLRESNQVIDGLNHAATGMRSGVSQFKVAA
jgi:methyl-accepting chemotaxis protein